jgi:hypothetical protein
MMSDMIIKEPLGESSIEMEIFSKWKNPNEDPL